MNHCCFFFLAACDIIFVYYLILLRCPFRQSQYNFHFSLNRHFCPPTSFHFSLLSFIIFHCPEYVSSFLHATYFQLYFSYLNIFHCLVLPVFFIIIRHARIEWTLFHYNFSFSVHWLFPPSFLFLRPLLTDRLFSHYCLLITLRCYLPHAPAASAAPAVQMRQRVAPVRFPPSAFWAMLPALCQTYASFAV